MQRPAVPFLILSLLLFAVAPVAQAQVIKKAVAEAKFDFKKNGQLVSKKKTGQATVEKKPVAGATSNKKKIKKKIKFAKKPKGPLAGKKLEKSLKFKLAPKTGKPNKKKKKKKTAKFLLIGANTGIGQSFEAPMLLTAFFGGQGLLRNFRLELDPQAGPVEVPGQNVQIAGLSVAVPGPTPILLMAAGLLGLAAVARRRRRA